MKAFLTVLALLCAVLVGGTAEARRHHHGVTNVHVQHVSHVKHHYARKLVRVVRHYRMHRTRATVRHVRAQRVVEQAAGPSWFSDISNFGAPTSPVTTITHWGERAVEYVAHPRIQWCGWWMQRETGITSEATKLNLNMAVEWRRVGRDAGGPHVGAIVVWSHHVAKIVGFDGHNWIIRSGNDGGAVRTRPMSLGRLGRVIAFRDL